MSEGESTKQQKRAATFALLVATLFWGCGFTWAKAAGAAVNDHMALGHGAPLGPIWLLSLRFTLGGVLWMILVPASRRGWTWKSIGRAGIVGAFLAAGLVAQHLGLDRSKEAVTAFLTSLTILFVPLLMTIVLRRPPPGILWGGAVLATVGVWLMTGASRERLGVGEILSLGCAVLFSLHLISVNVVIAHDVSERIAPGQFFAVAIFTGITCLFLPHGIDAMAPAKIVQLVRLPDIGLNLALMIVLVTVCAFGLQTHFQPRLDPTRAVLLYLAEPIFAAVYAWIVSGHGLGATEIAGAALILAANALVEIIQSRRKTADSADAGTGAAIID